MHQFLDSENDSLQETTQHFTESVKAAGVMVLVIWVFYIFQWLSGGDWGAWGIYPRRIWGMTGIITAPLVHGSWGHLASNSAPLFVLTGLTFYFYRKVAARSFTMIYLLTGIAVWLLARPVYHIGASGVVYGLVAFIFWNGIFRRSVRSIVLALLVLLFYAGMFMGVLPDQEGVSWESHLLGSLAGIFTSFWFKSELEEDEQEHHRYVFGDETEKQFFLPGDAFEMTKTERAEAEKRAAEETARVAEEDRQPYFPPNYWRQDWTI